MRHVLSLAILLSTGAAYADDPPGNPPAHTEPPRKELRGPATLPSNAQRVNRGVPAPLASGALRGRGDAGLPEGMQERMARLRERQAEMKARHERAKKIEVDLETAIQSKDSDPTETKKLLDEYRELRRDRQRDHRLKLHRRYRTELKRDEVKGELERHARRMARLVRLEALIATERKGAPRQKLLERVKALREAEAGRHERLMVSLVPTPPAAPPAGDPAEPAPAAAPASPGAAQ